MNKGLYITFDEIGNPQKSGIWNKVKGQCKAFERSGYTMDLIHFKSKTELYLNHDKVLKTPSRQLVFRHLIFRKIWRICQSNSYKFLYIRYTKSDFHFLQFLKKVHHADITSFIEFPTFPYDEELQTNNPIEQIINMQDRFYRNKLHHYTDYAASIVKLDYNVLGIPTFQLDNGVDLDEIPVHESKADQRALKIIGVANLSKWHGWDRVLRGIYNYKTSGPGKIKIYFKIIGSGHARQELMTLRDQLGLQENVQFIEPKTGKELDEEFKTADIAMGSLGMHRIGLSSGSVLKLREYTARGIPSVIGYNDSILSENESFVFKVPADESAIQMEDLISFHRNMSISNHDIRKFAVDHFSWDKVLLPVFNRIG